MFVWSDFIFTQIYLNLKNSLIKQYVYLDNCLNLETLETIECHKWLLKFDFLYDLHGGQGNDEQIYIQKVLMSTFDGGLWGNFIAVF